MFFFFPLDNNLAAKRSAKAIGEREDSDIEQIEFSHHAIHSAEHVQQPYQ